MALDTPNDIWVNSWEELNQIFFRYSWMNDRFRSPFMFRGLSNKDWKLETSLIRLGHPDTTTIRLEPVILRGFKYYA